MPDTESKLERSRRWLPAVAWAGVISFFSTGWFTAEHTAAIFIPILKVLLPHAGPEELRAWHMLVRKLAHFTEYLVLSVLLYQALRNGRRWRLRTALTALAIAAAYSALDEFHQTFVMGRTGAASDSLIDISGAFAGQILIAVWDRAMRAGTAGVTRRVTEGSL